MVVPGVLFVMLATTVAALPTLVHRDDPVYAQVRRLALAAGSAPPSAVSPLTAAELLLVLGQIDLDALSADLVAEYQEVTRRLRPEPDGAPFGSVGLVLSPEFYLHTSDDPGTWRYWYPHRRSVLSVPIRVKPLVPLAIEFDLDWRRNYPFFPGTDHITPNPDPVTNVPFDVLESDVQFPFRALVSAGGEHWSLQYGRGLVTLGSGESGSLFLSDHVDYHEYLMASVWGRLFSYRALYLDLEAHYTGPVDNRMFFAHRIEMRPAPWLSLAANDGWIYAGPPLELRYFNPLMIMHSWFLPDRGNSLLSFEAAVRPVHGLEVYGHFAIEQLQIALEEERGYAEGDPNAFGFLAGLEYAVPLPVGWLTVGAEWVHLDPWMYIGRNLPTTFTYRRLVQAEHVRNPEGVPVGAKVLVEKPLGYPAGPDYYEVLVHAKAGLRERVTIGVQARFAAKGENELGRPVEIEDPADAGRRTPSGDAPEYLLHARLAGEVLIGEFVLSSVPLELRSGAVVDAIRVLNRGYEAGKILRDLQFSPYVSVQLRHDFRR